MKFSLFFNRSVVSRLVKPGDSLWGMGPTALLCDVVLCGFCDNYVFFFMMYSPTTKCLLTRLPTKARQHILRYYLTNSSGKKGQSYTFTKGIYKGNDFGRNYNSFSQYHF